MRCHIAWASTSLLKFLASTLFRSAISVGIGHAMSRPLVEYTVRQKLQERRNITLRDRCRVTQLVTIDGDGGALAPCAEPAVTVQAKPWQRTLSLMPRAAARSR